MPEGSLTLTRADTSTVVLTPATARPAPVEYDAEPFRPPFGTAWFAAGDGYRQVERLQITLEAHDADGITSAATALEDALAELRAAVLITTPWGAFAPMGVESFTRSPIADGWRAEAVVATFGRNEAAPS